MYVLLFINYQLFYAINMPLEKKCVLKEEMVVTRMLDRISASIKDFLLVYKEEGNEGWSNSRWIKSHRSTQP